MAEIEQEITTSTQDKNSIQETELININDVCRLCLSKTDIFSIYKSDKLYDDDKNLSTIIRLCVAVKISLNDGLPNFICQECYKQINSWYDFKNVCISTQLKLNEFLKRQSENDKIQQDNTSNHSQPIRVKQEPVELPNEEDENQENDINIEIQNPIYQEIESPTRTDHPSDINAELPHRDNINDNYEDDQINEDAIDYDDVDETIYRNTEDSGNSQQQHSPLISTETDYTPLLLAHQIKKEPRVVLEELADEMLQSNSANAPNDSYDVVDNEDDEDEDEMLNEMEMDGDDGLESSRVGHPLDSLTCPVCFNKFDTTDLVMQHLCNQDCKIKYTCREKDCLRVFDTYDTFRCHNRAHYSAYTCKKCKKCLYNKEQYFRHRNSEDCRVIFPNLNYATLACNICCKTYSSKENLSKHVCGQKYFYCPKCQRQCTFIGRLVAHAFKCLTAQVMQDSINEPVRNEQPDTYHQENDIIVGSGGTSSGTNENEYRRSKRILFTCECSKTFSNENQLEMHKMKEHIMLEMSTPTPTLKEQQQQLNHLPPSMIDPTSKVLVIRKDLVSDNPSSNYSGNLCCKICRRHFQSTNKLRRHLQAHLRIKLYKCHLCMKSLSCEDSLQKHFTLMHGIFYPKKFIIENNKCQKTNILYEQYLKKNNLMNNHRTYQKRQIPQQQIQQQQLPMMMDDYNESIQGLSSQELESNTSLSSLQNQFACKICQKIFFDEDVLNGHIKSVHSSMRTLKCSFCPKSFSNPKHLYQHNKIHRGKKLFTCQVCMTRFLTQVQLRRHREDEHVLSEHFPCIRCNNETIFNNEHDWQNHQNIHPKTRHFACQLCLKVFFSTDVLNEHRKTHISAKIYNCSACKNSFSTLTALAKHKRFCLFSKVSHQQQQQLSNIKDINSDFGLTQKEMKIEIRKEIEGAQVPTQDEEEENSYECNICYRVFKQMKHLTDHMRLQHQKNDTQQQILQPLPKINESEENHTNSYECNVCSRVFNRRHNYVEHMRAHQRRLGLVTKPVGKKKLKCHICSKNFNRIQNLHSHLRAHQRQLLREQAVKFNQDEPLQETNESMTTPNDEILTKTTSASATASALTTTPSTNNLPELSVIPKPIKSEFKCPICAKTFDQEVKMKLHKNYHFRSSSTIKQIGNMYTCQLCGQNFTSKSNLLTHRNFCQEVFKTKTMPSRASKLGNRSLSPTSLAATSTSNQPTSTTTSSTPTTTSTASPQNQINNIDSSTINPGSLKNDISNSSIYQSQVYRCDKCPREFLNKKALAAHRYKAHVMKALTPNMEIPGFSCYICNRRFAVEANLKRHITTVHEKKRYNQNNWMFDSNPASTSRRHTLPSTSNSMNMMINPMLHDNVLIMDEDDDDDINIYNNMLLDQDDMMMDEDYGVDDLMQPPKLQPQMPPPPPLQPNPQQQQAARMKNNDDFPFQCMVCFKRFKLKEYLDAHFKMHTGEKPYKCRFCSCTFAKSSLVYKHCLNKHAQEYDRFRRQKMMQNV